MGWEVVRLLGTQKAYEGDERITLRWFIGKQVVRTGGGWSCMMIVPKAGSDNSDIKTSEAATTVRY
jgi:hypothetical protein